jgi:large subunit ribosomal protein L24
MKLRIKKNDTIKVIAGAEKGKTGKVLQVNRDAMRVLVEGINVRKKHVRAGTAHPEGGIIELERPIHYSNVMLMDENEQPTRLKIQRERKDGVNQITRIAKTTGNPIA